MLQRLRSSKGRLGAIVVVAILGAGTIVGVVDANRSGHRATSSRVSTGPAARSSSELAAAPSTTAPVAGRAGNATKQDPSDVAKAPSGGAVEATPPDSVLPPAPAPVGTKIVKNGSLSLEVKRHGLDESLGKVLTIVGTSGGAVQSSESSGRTATFVLRIPAARFEQAVVDLRKLGKRTSNSLSSEEVTAQYVDLEARLRNLRAQVVVMLDLMRQAKSIPDSITVQQQLSAIQGQIEELEGQRRVLDDQTTFATLAVTLTEEGAPLPAHDKPEAESQLARSWHQATDAALAIVGGTLVVLGAVVPLALILAPVGLVIFVTRRRRRVRPAMAS